MNLKILPDSHSGTAIREGYPRYIMAGMIIGENG